MNNKIELGRVFQCLEANLDDVKHLLSCVEDMILLNMDEIPTESIVGYQAVDRAQQIVEDLVLLCVWVNREMDDNSKQIQIYNMPTPKLECVRHELKIDDKVNSSSRNIHIF